MLERLRFISAGESHGPYLTALLEGMPSGLSLCPEGIDRELARRQKGFGSGGRMRIERDRVELSAGWMGGRTTGGPIALRVANRDWANWAQRDIDPMTIPRPGHVDLVAALKYDYRDLRPGLERASARETTMRVAAGAVCRQLLESFGVRLGGYVRRIGGVELALDEDASSEQLEARASKALDNDLCCPNEEGLEPLRAEVKAAMKARDTLGGVFEVFALGLPPGLGSYVHWERRLDARLAMALMSIQAMKGVEVGPAFANAGRRGTAVHDELLRPEHGPLRRASNRAGGLEGGMTTGEPLVLRVAMKPISTTLDPLRSVDLKSGEPARTCYERSDFCALPRAVPIGEAMVSLVLADALLAKLGGDHLAEQSARFAVLKRGAIEDFSLDGEPWRFGYEVAP